MKMLTRPIAAALAASVIALGASAGCALESPDSPSITGPSTFAVAVNVTASPDVLPEDGLSQSVIRIVVRDSNGQPLRNVALRVDTVVGSTIVDFGVLSARNVTTNANGEASVIFTAPRAPQFGVDTNSTVTIAVTQVGTDAGSSQPAAVRIRLVPESTASIPGSPTPNFFFTPQSPRVGDRVTFDASSSRDTDGTIVRYRWDYGDGEIEEGPVNTKDYTAAGTYLVTLTVTDNQGKTASLSKAITVAGT
ncbi:MAG: PKD domain-containing protein [Acidobacteriota bacterium]|nr:PKD domain-containing protein [Acidobacteriota bacterium]